jgi:hypothetical protein
MTASHEQIDQWIDDQIADARTSGARTISLEFSLGKGLAETEASRVLARIATCFPECRRISFPWDTGDAWLVALAARARHLPALQFLDLGYSKVGDAGLRALAAQALHLPALRVLRLSGTAVGDAGLRALAAQALHLPALQILDLNKTRVGDAGLRVLAAQAQHLPALEDLYLAGTAVGDAGLRALAAQALHLPALQCLTLSGTKVGDAGLRALAAQALHLPALQILDLGSTEVGDVGLQALAEVAHQLPNLRFLYVRQTPVSLPDEVKSSGNARPILSYIRDRLSAGRPLGEIKLLLVGQGAVGKTHLRKRVLLPDGPDMEYYDADEDRTHDADRCDFVIDLPQEKAVAGSRITVRVWDFGGQSYLHSTHRFFLGGQRCFYLLVLRADAPADGEADDSNRLSYWLRLLAHYGQDSQGHKAPVIVVVSQCDRVELAAQGGAATGRHSELLEALRTAQEQGWYGANVVRAPIDGFGWSPGVLHLPSGVQSKVRERHRQATEAIRQAVQDHVGAVPDIGNAYPSQFFRVKALIEEVFAPATGKRDGQEVAYLNFKQHPRLRKVCEDHGIPLDSVALYLTILKSLGVVHWVGDVSEVRRDVNTDMQQLVFNPEWVRRPVYELIRFAEGKDAGVLHWDELNQHLPAPRPAVPGAEYLYRRLPFEERDRNNIVALMKACRLAYDEGHRDGLLVPDLLRAVKPHEKAVWQGDDVSVWRLEADFLPEKIFLRYIAEHYHHIEKPSKECFRNEVVLCDKSEGTAILIHPAYSPAGGARPYLDVAVRSADADVRKMACEVLRREFAALFEREGLGRVRLTIARTEKPPQAEVVRDEPPGETAVGLAAGKTVYVFHFNRNKKRWEVGVSGQEPAESEDEDGFRYLYRLIQSPNTPVRADHLCERPLSEDEFRRHEKMDRKGNRAVRDRMQELDEKKRREPLTEDEHEEYERCSQLLKGTERFNTAADNTAKAVRQSIQRALKQLGGHQQLTELAAHLASCAHSDRYHFRYQSNDSITWQQS